MTIDDVLLSAHDQVFRMSDVELSGTLALRLGRVTVARLTGSPDANTVSRWAKGRNSAAEYRLDRMRHAAYLFYALLGLGFSESSARQWFRNSHPALEDEKPMDVIARGDFRLTVAALRRHGFAKPHEKSTLAFGEANASAENKALNSSMVGF